MEQVYDLLKELKNLGARIYIIDNKIKLDIKEGALTSEISEKIKYYRNDILAIIGESSVRSEFIQIKQVAQQESYPISDAQRRLWVLSQFEGGAVAYNSPSSVVLEGDIDIESFKRAIASTIERHEVLRTILKEDESGEIRQWILRKEDLGFKIDYRDYRKENNTDGKVREYIAEDSYKAFDLEKGPLLRAGLLQVEDERYVFYLNMHHIISDGWSMEVLSKDVMSYYDAYKENKEPALKPLRIQYKDYSAWQLGQLKEESYKDHRAYWLKSLEGELPLLNLPSAKQQRPRIKTSNGRTLRTYLNKEVSDMLKKYSQEKGGSLFMGLLASWNVILYRYTGQQDMIIGSPVAGREHADLEDQIGFYVNTLALRNEIDPEESFDSLFLRVKQKTLTAYSHQMYPFDKLVEELNLVRDTSRSAVFDVMLVLQNNGERVEGVELKEEELNQITDHGYCTSRFDMEISVQEIGDYLVLQVGYNPDVYEKEMVEGLMKHYNQLLKALLKDPGEALSQIDYLSESEKHQLLVTFNDTGVDYPKDKTIVELFGDQAEKTPHNIAVVFEENKLTYGQLDEKSNQLAHYLQKNYDIKPDDLVGIKLDRSEWMIVSVLGVLKAGGAYVPIDPEYPQERIDYIEKDTRCKVCIGEKELENFRKNQKKYSTEKVTSNVRSGNLAYVIYTSGSTGKPKGVMIEHANLVSFMSNLGSKFRLERIQKIAGSTNLAFDISALEIFGSLCNGKELIVLSKDELNDPHKFLEKIERSEVDGLQLTPSRLSQIYSITSSLPKVISLVLIGGEALSELLYATLKKESFESINVYGPTETTIWSTSLNISYSQRLSIGAPLSNENAYILNGEQLQPVGVVGELCIGGEGLSRGYLNQVELTREKFIVNPFKAGERIYKTGDLGRWLPDGNIEFIGRKDDQVKIRGYRIELGEIEHALQSHLEIDSAVVLAKENKQGEKELVAYITSKEEQNTSELRSYLKELLPEYMVPAYFVQLEAMPLTSNGKVDKRSLPDPKGLGLSSGVEYVAPRNAIEKKLVKIWEGVLQRENIGIKDDFFALGGHSLKAVRLSNAYVKELSVKISLKDLFAHTSIESHVALISSSKKIDFIQIEPVAIQESYPISDAQRRLWVLSQFENGSVAYNSPASIVLEKSIDIGSFKRAIDSTIERHEILRTVFKEDTAGAIRQWILKREDLGFKIDYKDYRKEKNKDEKVKEYITADSYKAFDLEQGPLLRAGLLQVEDEEYIFYYNMHHIISDGWSMEVLSKDVMSYYDAYKENKEPALKPLRIQYKDYSAWQLGQLKEESYKDHRAYWLKSLEGELPLLNLPSAKQQRPRVKTHDGRTLRTYLNKELSQKLKRYSEINGGTVFMGLLAAWNVLMCRYTSQADIIIGTPIAGREHVDLEDQIGFYINTLALRNAINPEENFDELFSRVKHSTLNAYSHQMYPFDRLVEELNLIRDTSRSAVFDILLDFHNTGEKIKNIELGKAETDSIVDAGKQLVKYDLELHFTEVGDYILIQVNYNEDVYEKQVIEGVIAHYKRLMVELIDNSTESVGGINFLSKQEKNQLILEFNDTKVDYPKEKTILDLFEEQVGKTPDAAVIRNGDKALSYKELDELSNQFAHCLIKNCQVKASDIVGIKLDKGDWSVISILGVLKTGAGYVPIDPEYPSLRKQHILSESKIKLLITDTNYLFDNDEFDGSVFAVDVEFDKEVHSKERVNLIQSSASLAYVIYTSGSTGNPKGVMIDHASLMNYLIWARSAYRHTSLAGLDFGLFSSLSFDLTVTSLYLPLISGGALTVFDSSSDISSVLKTYFESDISCIKLTPAHISLLKTLEIEKTQVQTVIVGGDKLENTQVAILKKLNRAMRIYNEYGPTESTVGCIIKEIVSEKEDILIGKPISNTQIYILSPEGSAQPVGVAGEICVGGAGLSRGYLNQPDLTKEKFIKNPFKAGERMYKTGDLGRWLADGNIEFIGRKDDQVKIRGYRIELGEIEHALLRNEKIKEAVVIVKANENKEKELVAYITSKEEQNTSELRSYLKELVPEYMVPGYFVQLGSMPLTSNGKVDKKSLPDPQGVGLTTGMEYVAPRNEIEEKLVKIWQDVLQKDHIGIKDDFFVLGGHSLKAVQLSNEYGKELGVKLSLKELFIHTSIQQQAPLIESLKENEFVKKYDQIPRAEKKTFYVLSSAQKRLYFLQKLSPESVSYNMPQYYFFNESLDPIKLDQSLCKLIDRHEILRTYFADEQGTVVQKISQEVSFSTDYHECTDLSEVNTLVQSAIKAFDLSQAPLLRSVLIKMKDQYVWIIDIHHIISDGTSGQILLSDMMSIYQGIELSVLSISYKDYAEWQNKLSENGELKKQQNYWTEKLSGELPVLNFPADFSRPAAFTFQGSYYTFRIDEIRAAELKRMGDRCRGTLQMSLMAILKILVFKYTGQEDLIIGCGISGRSHNELEDMVGMFVNMLAIRSEASDAKTFSSFYKEEISTSLEAYDNQDVQFDDLVDTLKITRDISRNPIFDIALVVQNFNRAKIKQESDIVVATSGYNLLDLNFKNTTSKFDLTFFVNESAEEIEISIEYYTGIFKESTVKRIADHFNAIVDQVVANDKILISDIDMLSESERGKLLSEFNATTVKYPKENSIHSLFSKQSILTPDKIAVSDEEGSYTYLEIEKSANRLGNFLKQGLNIPIESYVGILQSRNKEIIPSILGVLKSGGGYLNLDAEFPEERLLYMLKDARVKYLLTEKNLVGLANRLQWRTEIEHIICIDSQDIYAEHGGLTNDLMRKDLWDFVGDRAVDAITAGGWLSSYTGHAISAAEMQEYSDNAYLKLKKLLHKEMKVLEIGCSSGLTMFQVAPQVSRYYGTDLSSSILEYAQGVAIKNGHENVYLKCMPAHEIDLLGEKDFDLIIINSVIQCFEDHNYLRDILKKSIGLLKEEGVIFAGDLMDEDERLNLIEDLKAFKRSSTDPEFKTKMDWSSELFVSRAYFKDLLAEDIGIADVDFSGKIYTIENELTKFRYDALLRIDKKTQNKRREKNKYQHDLSRISQYKDTDPGVEVKADNLAYVMYTSGSTGQPKGVMIEHRSVVRLVKNTNIYSFSSGDTLLSTGAISFDATTFEYWGPLLNGAKLILCSQKMLLDSKLLHEEIKSRSVNIMWFTSGWLNQLVESEIGIFNDLKTILAGGDKLSPDHIGKLRRNYPGLQIINGYGPTENTTFSNTYTILEVDGNIPIGKPINNSTAYILSKHNSLLPIGVIGEICVGGAGLACGYLNQEELTKEKFIKNPFKAGERLYKTGDLGRWLADGNIEFIGRKDDQVKIRGHRIELGEIEHALLKNEQIQEAVVLAKQNHENEKELVAYITAKSEQNASELRSYLKELLPEYMLPVYYVQMEALPLNANGKIDKKAFLDPQGMGIKSGVEYVGPRNETEEKLVKIWQEVLQRENIGVKDDFFELGGHSLTAIRTVSKINDEFESGVKIRNLFNTPTIEDLSYIIDFAINQKDIKFKLKNLKEIEL